MDGLHTCRSIVHIAQRLVLAVGIDVRRNTLGTHVKHIKSGCINVGINNDDTFDSRLNEPLKQHTCLEELTVKEYLLYRRHICSHEEIYLILQIVNPVGVLLQSAILNLKTRINLPLNSHQLLIENISFEQVFLNYMVCPLPEFYTALALYTIADRYDNVQIIIRRFILLIPLGTHVCKFCTCDIFEEFVLVVDITDVAGNNRPVTTKESGDLLYTKPYRLIG